MARAARLLVIVCLMTLLVPVTARAQLLNSLTTQELTAYTSPNPFDRFADGRPKIPDALLTRARDMSAEEITGGYNNRCVTDLRVLHPGMKISGRAFTVQFMPSRPEVEAVTEAKAKAGNLGRINNQYAFDQLQPGDVLVVDLFGKIDGGTLLGDNLFYYVMKATRSGGIVVDGAIRDLEGVKDMKMPLYYRGTHPSAISNVMLTGVNVPIRIGGVTVMPGDLVMGDAEAVCFVPPDQVTPMLDAADRSHIHDEWTRMKFNEGKYKSRDIYGSPTDPALLKEYQEYLQRRLEELKKQRGGQ
jgi:4-hydroxy-4-methyl-2-oxoglutarate aldolase